MVTTVPSIMVTYGYYMPLPSKMVLDGRLCLSMVTNGWPVAHDAP